MNNDIPRSAKTFIDSAVDLLQQDPPLLDIRDALATAYRLGVDDGEEAGAKLACRVRAGV